MIFEEFNDVDKCFDQINDYHLDNNTGLVLNSILMRLILLQNDKIIHRSDFTNCEFKLSLGEFEKFIFDLNLLKRINKNDNSYFYFNKNSLINLVDNSYNDRTIFSIYLTTIDVDIKNKLEKFIEENKLTPEEVKGEVYMISQQGPNLITTKVGSDYHPLNRNNYSKESLIFHDKVSEEFLKNTPSGTIAILSGRPGTGKTYLIRSLIGQLKNSLCVFVPPSFVSNMMGPQLVELLVRTKRDYSNKENICLILEDADEILAPRMSDNISSISTLLNLTDGILGRILNIRVIATTNTSEKKFDSAIMRPGRLFLHEKMGKLSIEQCSKIYKNITGIDKFFDKEYSLAEIYEISKTKDEKIFQQDVRIGF